MAERGMETEKVVASLISNFDVRFQDHVAEIKRHTSRINDLEKAANLAMLLDSKDKLDMTAKRSFPWLANC